MLYLFSTTNLVEVEGHMAFTAMFKQQYQKTLSKKHTVPQAHH